MPDNTPVTKAEFDGGLENLKKDLKEYIDERTHDAETRLLRGFADYNSAGPSPESELRVRVADSVTEEYGDASELQGVSSTRRLM